MRGRMLAVPAHFDAEVYRVLRAYDRARVLPRGGLDRLVPALRRLNAERVALAVLVDRAHALGPRFSASDAFYVALAAAAQGELITRDRRLAQACLGLVAARLV